MPQNLIEYGTVSLWAQHVGQGDKVVNIRMPGILSWLRRFAEAGVGFAEEYENVKYKFMHGKLFRVVGLW